MNRLEDKFTKGFYKSVELKHLEGVHKYYIKLRAYVINNEHDKENFLKVTNDYIHYINSLNFNATLNLDDENNE